VAPFLRRETRHSFTNEIRSSLAGFDRESLSELDAKVVQDEPQPDHRFATIAKETNN
jgi:hypothetical protein